VLSHAPMVPLEKPRGTEARASSADQRL
jgi:hypothetical protein